MFALSFEGLLNDYEDDLYIRQGVKSFALGYIQVGQIHNAKNCERFHYTDYESNVIHCNAIDSNSYNYYFTLYNNFKNFGLPSGRWSDERQWFLDFISMIKVIEDKVISRFEKQRTKRVK